MDPGLSDAEPTLPHASEAPGISLAPPVLRGAKILLVDDDASDLRALEDILRRAGWTSIAATREPAAVPPLHAHDRFDLIVLDLDIPGADAFQVMRELEKIEGGYLPLLVVTTDPAQMRRALDHGARDFIAKPYRDVEVLARVRNVVDARVARREAQSRGRFLQRRLAERTADLRQSKEVFTLFANQVPEALWIRAVEDRTFAYVNPAWERVLGFKLQAGDTVEDALTRVHPQDMAQAAREMALHPDGGLDSVMRFIRPDGAIRWAHVRTFPIRDEAGRLRWVAGILEDITQRRNTEAHLERYAGELEREVAERQRTEEALRETEAQFRALVEQSVAAIYLIDGWRLAYANPRFFEILGYSFEELRGRDLLDIVVEEDRELLRQNRRRAMQGDAAALVATYRMRRKSGELVHLAVGGRFVELRGRQVLLGIAQDLTGRIVEHELRMQAEMHYTALVEQSIVGIYIRSDDRLVYVSRRLLEILGYEEERLRSLALPEIVVPEDYGIMADVLRRRREGDTGPIRVTLRVRRGDGRAIHVDMESKVIQLGGRRETVVVVQDVSEREHAAEALRLSEEKYRLLWETSTDAVILVDDAGTIKYANASVREVFGYGAEELEGQHIRLLQPPRLRRRHEEGMARFLETGERRLNWRGTELPGLHRDGHEFPVELSFSRLAVGGKSLFAAFMRDITDRRAAQAALEHAYERLQALSERILDIQENERRALSLELHDDVGQSLVAMRIGLHRLGAGLPAEQAKLLAECDAVAEKVQGRLRELSQQLHPPQLSQLGLRDALRWLAERQREITGLDIRCSFSEESEPRLAAAVESACYRICQEALNNATRHAQARCIRVGLERLGKELLVSVADDGVGFDAREQREHAPGRGSLGLIGMEQRARAAGGRLEVESAPGLGTRVSAFFGLEATLGEETAA